MLDTLRRAGLDVAGFRLSGTCGTCTLTLVDGEADHQDVTLEPAERATPDPAVRLPGRGKGDCVGPLPS